MDKKSIRKDMISLRDSVEKSVREQADQVLRKRLWAHPWVLEAEAILCFMSYGSEVDTHAFIEEALLSKKRVFAPKVLGKHEMEFYEITKETELVPGYAGILEPKGDSLSYTEGQAKGVLSKVLMIMPGVAFDREGNRLGYGGGFYDTYLEKHKELQAKTLAVGYAFQEVDKVPAEERDFKPGEILLV